MPSVGQARFTLVDGGLRAFRIRVGHSMSRSDAYQTLAAQAIYARKRRTVPLERTVREQRKRIALTLCNQA